MQGQITRSLEPSPIPGASPNEVYTAQYPQGLPLYEQEIVEHAIRAYGFLVPTGQTQTLEELAGLIETHCDQGTPMNREVARVLRL